MNILFTCAGRRNYLINYFKDALKNKGITIATDINTMAPAMLDADLSFEVPSIYASNYIDCLLKIIESNKIKALISLNDLELPILSKNRKRLEAKGIELILSNENIISICYDKYKTHKFIEQIGLKSPKTFITLDDVLESLSLGLLKFPLVIKPRWGSASIGLEFPESIEELKMGYKLQQIKLKKSILYEASKECIEHALVIQEKIEGDEYGMDILNDLNGIYFGTFVRKKLAMRSGETDKAISIIDERFEQLGAKISRELRHVGNMDCDIFLKGDDLYILELNPRFGGGYPFSHEAGINSAAIIVAWLEGDNNISLFSNYKAGVAFAKYDKLMALNKLSKS